MHQAPGSSTALDFLLPSSRAHHELASSTYSQTGWPQPILHDHIQAYANTAGRPRALDLTNYSNTIPQREHEASKAPHKAGLRTPPFDEMSVYQPHQYQNAGSSRDSGYATSSHSNESSTQVYYPHSQVTRTDSYTRAQNGASSQPYNYERSRSPRDVTGTTSKTNEEPAQKKDAILRSLQIPASINASGGSLGEFAAQITCLFWFESTETLRKAENWTPNSSPIKRLVPDAIPTIAFRKWVVTILSTTQVTQNVILLALLFIYRLKTLNPTVKGKAGSEYRLLTVALMLGNKFLDDNTYTNKTWAEVSGIAVGEIHVMEVEFLSNMRYSLLASKEQWEEWQVKLRKFAEYSERASKAASPLPSPVHNSFQAPPVLPSTPTSLQSSPPALSTYPPNSAPYNYNQTWPNHYQPPTLSPLSSMPAVQGKKRGSDEAAVEPPPKRVTRSTVVQLPAQRLNQPTPQLPSQLSTQLQSQLPSQVPSNPPIAAPQPRHNAPRLPVPHLSISTSAGMGYPTFPQTLPPLPPLNGRAMSSVYPVTPSWTPQPQMSLTPSGPTQPLHSQPASNYGTPTRRHSPHSVQGLLSMNSSPISASFPHDLNSPSFFLQRNSPYKPVMRPHTLLVPPPLSSYQHFPTTTEHMHYQPLGKRNDYRSGVVPEYANGPPGYQQPWLPPVHTQAYAS